MHGFLKLHFLRRYIYIFNLLSVKIQINLRQMKNQYIKYINAIIQNRLETMPREMEIISLNLLFPLPMDHKQTNKQTKL